MSMGSSWQQFSRSVPPERGSFPLDFHALCKDNALKYMKCLKENQGNSSACREMTKLYLECRMANKLMDRDSLANLGFSEDVTKPDQPKASSKAP
ncbi:uncharacterized protein BJ171DRAFT_505503 [Polychytrium aggregatum]|uniref:uncharacterized protein n=1 Tax=Polychytrium aggregatum TaxID=110093 RepID=UPI0022FE8E6F|nr:uncharacterized protein BJ171DRAFT_505503 [Polychytrium aggregatum]KAI9204328.1 hypothetical protein BJ171DRAFT_505503 [Polychytrium aggregatum]